MSSSALPSFFAIYYRPMKKHGGGNNNTTKPGRSKNTKPPGFVLSMKKDLKGIKKKNSRKKNTNSHSQSQPASSLGFNQSRRTSFKPVKGGRRAGSGDHASKTVATTRERGIGTRETKNGAVDERVRRQACAALTTLLNADATAKHGASIKSLTLGERVYAKRATYALTIETLRYLPVLRIVARESGMVDVNTSSPAGCAEGMKPCLLYVLMYEMLIGPSGADALRLPGAGGAARKVASAEDDLRKAADSLCEEHGVAHLREVLGKLTSTAARQHTRESCFVRVNAALTPQTATTRKICAKLASELDAKPDEHVPLGLVVPASRARELAEHDLVANGHVILQGKSSCLAALALAPSPGETVVDCCAAPGNKTSHLAALVGSGGTVLAVERDASRHRMLRKRLALLLGKTSNAVRCVQADFLDLVARAMNQNTSKKRKNHAGGTDADDGIATLCAATSVLVDAPCSGSGTRNTRGDTLVANARDADDADASEEREVKRAAALGRLQAKLLTAALSLPSARRVVYSTCSIYPAENEEVVGACMEHAKLHGFHLKRALPSWPRRGLASAGVAGVDLDRVVRVDPDADGADGFFVALFEKSTRTS